MSSPSAAWMRKTIAEHRHAGEYVLQSARMVGDETDHAVWRRSRCAWRDAVISTLNRMPSDTAEAGALDVVLDGPPNGWKRLYEAELHAVQAGLVLLDTLEGELSCAPRELVAV